MEYMVKYIIDAYSLNDLQDIYPKEIPVFEPIYSKIYEMFENGDLFSVREVYEELIGKIINTVLES